MTLIVGMRQEMRNPVTGEDNVMVQRCAISNHAELCLVGWLRVAGGERVINHGNLKWNLKEFSRTIAEHLHFLHYTSDERCSVLDV